MDIRIVVRARKMIENRKRKEKLTRVTAPASQLLVRTFRLKDFGHVSTQEVSKR